MTGTIVFAALALARPLRAVPAGELAPFRLGFSTQMLAEVNETDARAALKVWAQTLGAERGFPVDPSLQILSGTDAIRAALLGKKIDGVSLTTPEYWALRRVVPLGPFIIGRLHGVTTVDYVLLVHRDNPAVRLADLRGGSVAVMQGARASLATAWMETLLLEEHLGRADLFWGRTTQSTKLTRVALPVFFRQVDACIVTREGFRTMSELNPQVGQQLKVLAQSPAMVPTVFCFCGDMVALHRDKFVAQIGTITGTPAGRQILVLFQSDEMTERPASDLDGACALLDRHQRLLADADGASLTSFNPAARPGTGERPR